MKRGSSRQKLSGTGQRPERFPERRLAGSLNPARNLTGVALVWLGEMSDRPDLPLATVGQPIHKDSARWALISPRPATGC
jgi:hypothetical protein